MSIRLFVFGNLFFISFLLQAQDRGPDFPKEQYHKREVYISMRDGVHLFTSIYEPKDTSQAYPVLMERTPYSCEPYGETNFPGMLGPNPDLMEEKYIFVYQDVRGRYMSEGNFLEMTPNQPNHTDPKTVDESTDTYDTVEWLLKNLHHFNGRVGIYGISYPGFYASASLPDAHPAIKAVSPQAPVTDEFIGDDANHKGAFYLLDNFNFLNYFDAPRKGPVKDYGKDIFRVNSKNSYEFFLKLGPISNSNNSQYYNNKGIIWNEYLQHDTYDAYWQARNIRPHLKSIKPAVLVVGGWFDAEDLFGALETYRAIENQNPQNDNRLVMGPWTHGAWADQNWTHYATHYFRQNTSQYFRDSVETPFFNFYLKDKGSLDLSEARVFETGSNVWKSYNRWPPANTRSTAFFLLPDGKLDREKPDVGHSFTSYQSHPLNPVPYTAKVSFNRNNEYMAEDQRFVANRKDVITFISSELKEDLPVTGPVGVDLFVSVSGTDADFIVKLVDVHPINGNKTSATETGMQQLVRAEPFRGKFRNSFEHPEPFQPGKVAEIKYDMPDIAHRFLKGHRIMIQIQSSWFPLVDRNPQKFMRIPDAQKSDFNEAEIKIFHEAEHPSAIILPLLNE